MIGEQQPLTVEAREMLRGRDLILFSRKFAVEFRRESWYHTLLTALLLGLAFFATLVNFHWTFKLISSFIFGLFIVKFFVIYHDYQHKAILQKSKLAEFIMTVFGIFVLAPTNIWKGTHDHHHNHNSKLSNSGIGSYPLISKDKFKSLPKKRRIVYLASRHPLTIFFGYITLFIYDFNLRSIFSNPIRHWDSVVALILHFGIAAVLFYVGGIEMLLFSWIIPFLFSHGLGSYFFYAQHNFPGATFENNRNWDYAKAAIDSTSFMVMNPLMNWFTGNIGYHHVHHINHNIPFYRLKEAMREMPELQNPKTTTLKLKDVIACLKLKVWDPKLGKMTGL